MNGLVALLMVLRGIRTVMWLKLVLMVRYRCCRLMRRVRYDVCRSFRRGWPAVGGLVMSRLDRLSRFMVELVQVRVG